MNNDALWDLRARGSAVDLFTNSCLHILRSTQILATAQAAGLRSELHAALMGLAVQLFARARQAQALEEEMSIEFEHEPDQVRVRVFISIGETVPEHVSAAAREIAATMTVENHTISLLVTRQSLERAVGIWMRQWRPPGTVPTSP